MNEKANTYAPSSNLKYEKISAKKFVTERERDAHIVFIRAGWRGQKLSLSCVFHGEECLECCHVITEIKLSAITS